MKIEIAQGLAKESSKLTKTYKAGKEVIEKLMEAAGFEMNSVKELRTDENVKEEHEMNDD